MMAGTRRWTCAHCGRTVQGYKEAIIRDGRNRSTSLCHPTDASLPDCYRRVVVYKEQVGALMGLATLPIGVKDIVKPVLAEPMPELDWNKLRDKYEFLGGTADPMVSLIRVAVERWLALGTVIRIAEQNKRRVPLATRAEYNIWEYRMLRLLGSRHGRSEIQDRVAEKEGWW